MSNLSFRMAAPKPRRRAEFTPQTPGNGPVLIAVLVILACIGLTLWAFLAP